MKWTPNTSCDSRTRRWPVPSWGILVPLRALEKSNRLKGAMAVLRMLVIDLRIICSRQWLAYFWACLWVGQFAALTAVVRPSITGGGGHSMRVALTREDPMVFGGARGADSCTDRVAVPSRPLARTRRRAMPQCANVLSFSYAMAKRHA